MTFILSLCIFVNGIFRVVVYDNVCLTIIVTHYEYGTSILRFLVNDSTVSVFVKDSVSDLYSRLIVSLRARLLTFGRVKASFALRSLKRSLHGGILVGQFLDGQFLCLIIGYTEVILRTQQVGLDFLQMVNALVYLLYGSLELLAGQAVVVGETLLEVVQSW